MPQAQMFSRTHGSVWRQASTIQVKCTTQKPSIQNLCFDRLFNKKNYMIIEQMWATSIWLFAYNQV